VLAKSRLWRDWGSTSLRNAMFKDLMHPTIRLDFYLMVTAEGAPVPDTFVCISVGTDQ